MRWFYLGVVIVFVAAILGLLFQNTQSVDVSFLSLGMTWPLALVVLVVYGLGALTGGSLYALLRRSIRGSRQANS
jgi:lipopolysaccharide assembly protein A